MEERKPLQKLRSSDILSLFSLRTGWRLARGLTRAVFERDFAGAPLAVCWFTNFTCNARCHFCCKSTEIEDKKDRFPPLTPDRAFALLEKIRANVNLLYLSGGEPTMHPHIVEILGQAKKLEFASVGISSNLILLDKKPEILDYVDAVSCSIHAPTPEAHAKNLGVSIKTAQRVFDNLDALEKQAREKGIRVLVNCVINKTNLHSVQDMLEFTRERGFLLEIVPANEKEKRPADLDQNPQYQSLIDDLLWRRKNGSAPQLAGSSHYYKTIRDFKAFRCFPYGVANIMPDASLCTPCDVSGQHAVNVLNHQDLKRAIKVSRPYLGDYPCKAGKCFKAGIIERSRLFGLLLGEDPFFLP